jgi:hypothetical protein
MVQWHTGHSALGRAVPCRSENRPTCRGSALIENQRRRIQMTKIAKTAVITIEDRYRAFAALAEKWNVDAVGRDHPIQYVHRAPRIGPGPWYIVRNGVRMLTTSAQSISLNRIRPFGVDAIGPIARNSINQASDTPKPVLARYELLAIKACHPIEGQKFPLVLLLDSKELETEKLNKKTKPLAVRRNGLLAELAAEWGVEAIGRDYPRKYVPRTGFIGAGVWYVIWYGKRIPVSPAKLHVLQRLRGSNTCRIRPVPARRKECPP